MSVSERSASATRTEGANHPQADLRREAILLVAVLLLAALVLAAYAPSADPVAQVDGTSGSPDVYLGAGISPDSPARLSAYSPEHPHVYEGGGLGTLDTRRAARR